MAGADSSSAPASARARATRARPRPRAGRRRIPPPSPPLFPRSTFAARAGRARRGRRSRQLVLSGAGGRRWTDGFCAVADICPRRTPVDPRPRRARPPERQRVLDGPGGASTPARRSSRSIRATSPCGSESVSGIVARIKRQLEREARRGGPAHVGLRVEQQRDHARQLRGRELRRLRSATARTRRGVTSSRSPLPRRGAGEQQVAEMSERLVREVTKVLSLLHEPVDHLEDGLATRRARSRPRARAAPRLAGYRATPSTTASSISASPATTVAWSRRESESRNDPSAWRAMRPAAPGESVTPSSFAILCRFSPSVSRVARLKSKRWQRPDDRRRHLVRLGRREDEANGRRRLLEAPSGGHRRPRATAAAPRR